MFASDDQYEKVAALIDKTKIKKKVLLSLSDHLPEKYPDYYKNIPERLYKFENKAKKYQESDESIVLI